MAEVINFKIRKGREVVSAKSAAIVRRIGEEEKWAFEDMAFVISLRSSHDKHYSVMQMLTAVERWQSAMATRALIGGDRNMVEMIWGKPKTMRCEVANY